MKSNETLAETISCSSLNKFFMFGLQMVDKYKVEPFYSIILG